MPPPVVLPARLRTPGYLVVLVTGGRFYGDRPTLRGALNEIERQRHVFARPPPTLVIVQGGASGADRMAREWAQDMHRRLITERADWLRYGKSAGVKRNQAMLDNHQPDLCIAAPGGRGTADMVERCHVAGVPVYLL